MFYVCEFCQSPLNHNDSVKDLGIFLDFKSHFHNCVDYMVSQCIKLLGLAVSVTSSSLSLKLLHAHTRTCEHSLVYIYTYNILPYLDLSFSTPLLFGILLHLLMPTNWNTSSTKFQPFVLIISFCMYNLFTLML
jgi:hypothetical protein